MTSRNESLTLSKNSLLKTDFCQWSGTPSQSKEASMS